MKVLETERLILRQMSLSDTENLLQIFSDPEAMLYYPGTKTPKETEEWIDWKMRSYRENDFGLWAAILKSSGEFTDQCGLVLQEVEGRREVEIGHNRWSVRPPLECAALSALWPAAARRRFAAEHASKIG